MKFSGKRLVVAGTAGILALSAAAGIFAKQGGIIRFDGVDWKLPPEARIENGQTLVPLAWIVERLGAKVAWNDKERLAEVEMPEATKELAMIESFAQGLRPKTAKEAVELWSRGIQNRSGALQYVVMSPALQEKSRKEFEEGHWVTGVSSPWAADMRFAKEEKLSDTQMKYSIEFALQTSEGSAGKAAYTLMVEKHEHGYWMITKIITSDEEPDTSPPGVENTNVSK
ncbi:stalk domain-containing protein [Brevibacillus borstelensis]|uniref:stalk domain-containing protein n=1 Tax=Brevibacillus borstelensis TaxID=45462 RepID=UPI0030BF83D1